jgi:trigger factor
MQVTQLQSDGLKREFKVVIAASDIKSKISDRLQEIGKTVRLPGFRPGKVPMPILKQRYGQAVMGEVLERAVSDSSQQAMAQHGLRPAMTPKVEVTSPIEEDKDFEFTMAVELLPEVKPVDFATLDIERLKIETNDADVDKALERIAQQNRKTEKISEDRPAQKGDIVVIDFVGTLDGVAFPGGSAKGHQLELGSGQFIPGFEDQLAGAKAGEKRDVKVSFPEDYGSKDLAGKAAVFAVDVHEIHEAKQQPMSEELAKSIGFEGLEPLKKAVREQIERDYSQATRARLKRELLDKLAEKHDFAVPQGMVDLEFEAIWKNVEEERKRGVDDPTIAGKSDDELKAEFRPIAERRVRLGLLLSEVGRINNIQVNQEEINRALLDQARRFPGQEKKVIEYFKSNPEALGQLRAPLFEDKVIDFIVELAKVKERGVSVEEFNKLNEEEAKASAKS